MKLTLDDIHKIVGGTLEGNPATVIEGLAGLTEAGDKDLSFLANLKYAPHVATTKAAAVIVPSNFPVGSLQKPLIKTSHPQLAFSKVLTVLAGEKRKTKPGVHPSAVVDPSVVLGQNVSIGPHAVIEEGARLGDNTVIQAQCYLGSNVSIGNDCLIYPQVVIREDCQVGDRCILHPGVVIGADGYGFATDKGRHLKIPQLGKVLVGEDVEIGANTTVDRGTTGTTVIGSGTKIDNLVQIAHNVKIGENCLIVAQVGIGGSTKIGNQVTIAGQVGIVGHIEIGDNVVAAAGTGIMNNIPAGSVVWGIPSRPHKEALKIQALLSKLPEIYETFKAQKKGQK